MMKGKFAGAVGGLSDKDIQLIKRTYCKLTQLYYQNTKNQASINDLINFSQLITQVISNKKESDTLSLLSTMQILKVKSKAYPQLIACADATITHLKNPHAKSIQYSTLLYSLQKSELFVAGCTIGIRFYEKINSNTSQFDWKEIINELSRNISVSAILCIEFVYQICRQNQVHSRQAVKSGLVKYIFLSHISNTLDNKYNLYKSIKLLKAISNAQRTILKQKQKSLALIIYTYQDYIPVVEEICSKCYDQEYGDAIDAKRKYDQNTIDQPYLWSYTQAFCLKSLSENTIAQFTKSLQTLNEERETKTYAILANYTKFRKVVKKQFLQVLPKNVRSLLNFIKLCVNCSQIDQHTSNLINLQGLAALVDKSESPKVQQLFKYLKQLRNKESRVGVINENMKKMFDMEKNADFMMERATKIPQNNEQLVDIKQILKQKDRQNEFESDTLKTLKEKALNSLQTAIIQKKKLNLDAILKQVELTDVKTIVKLLQILQLNLTMNQELIELINASRVMQIIHWIEQHYNGQLIDWSSIGQLIIILNKENQWKNHLKEIPQKSFWILGIQLFNEQSEEVLFNYLSQIKDNNKSYENKVPFIIGFLGRVADNDGKVLFYDKFKVFFDIVFRNLKANINYKTNLVMLSNFLRKWYEKDSPQNNSVFQEIIQKLVLLILGNFRSLEQEYEVLESCLPYKINADKLSQNVEYLVSIYGKLASYIYRQNLDKGNKIAISYDRIKIINKLAPEKSRNILEILTFLEENSQILQQDELSPLLDVLMNKNLVYWLMYPNFFNILSKIIAILTNSTNPALSKNITSILFKIFTTLNNNNDISDDERNDLFLQLQNCLESIGKRNIYVDKDKLHRPIEKIKDQAIKQETLKILNNMKVAQIIQNKQELKTPSQIVPIKPSIEIRPAEEEKKNEVEHSNLQDLQKRQEPFNIEQHFETISKIKDTEQLDVMQALKQLKKIIQKQLPQENFIKLNQIFTNNPFKEEHKDMLGYLLVKFYPGRPQNLKVLARQLMSKKQKTYLSKQSCYELLSKNKEAFGLAKRWKLSGKEWLDLAIERLAQGFYGIASQVVQYNLPRSADLEYFYSKSYHEIVLKNFVKVEQAEDLAYYMVLIGTSARYPQIKKYYSKDKLHIKILQAYYKYPQHLKLIGNLSFALSALAYIQPDICLQISKRTEEMSILLSKYRVHFDNRPIVESGACLIANLAYSNQEVKQILRQVKCCEIFLQIFEKNLNNSQISTFKHILRALGNLSLSAKFGQQMIDQHFCSLAVKMISKLDIFVNFDQKKAALMKILIDLTANLAMHRYKLDVFHKEKLTLSILTLIETTEKYPAILVSCIDTIDCLCQNPQIQNYVVTQKKILYLLIDILKIQTDEKIVVKSTRLLTNLTINAACIPYILQANLLSVLANIVMPHFYGNKLAAQQKKKMQTYILKIITRIYHSKQNKEVILKSGYLDCLVRTIETSDVIEDAYIEILYFYSEYLPGYLNKRAFLCLIKIITKKILNKDAVNRSFRIIKNLSNLYQREEEDIFIEQAPQMYEKLLCNTDHKEEGLFLLAYHLLRSQKLRLALQQKKSNVLQFVRQLSDDQKLVDLCRQISFVVYNPYSILGQIQGQGFEHHFGLLKNGFKCNLFRIDGSSKSAIIDINDEYQIRSYKAPNGQIKKKYVIEIRSLKDFQFHYPVSEQLWNGSVFTLQKGLFDSKKIIPQKCCSLIGSAKWGDLSFINVQFNSEQDKLRFERCISLIYHSIR